MAVATGQDAIDHYLAQVPDLRSDFADHLSDVRVASEKAERLFTPRYQTAVEKAALDEVRKRAGVAASSLRDAIDAGWHPTDDELMNTFVACFNPMNYEKDSLTDIKAAVNEFTEGLGRPLTPEIETKFNFMIGKVQVTSYDKGLTGLKMHLRVADAKSARTARARETDTKSMAETSFDSVFVTHGRDDRSKDAVSRFIYDVGLKPILLEEKPNEGQTIIEKYEKHANAAYGIAILSPDDLGSLREEAPDGLRPRARQNVIFELGFMFAKFGRNRVAVILPDEALERPTNIDGIVWIPLDKGGGWKYNLRKELAQAGLPLTG